MTFFRRLEARAAEIDSLLCVGLDPHPGLVGEGGAKAAWRHCMRLIEETTDVAAAFKPNIAFFEVLGPDGLAILGDVIDAVPDEIPVIVDAKRGDIGSTAEAYAAALFDELGADAVTLSPYLGEDSIEPFLARRGKGIFVLARTSNAGAGDIQDVAASTGHPFYELVVRMAADWASPERLGFVVGATAPGPLRTVRAIVPDYWILAPGVGAQGGDLGEAVSAGLRNDGMGMLFPVARAIAEADDAGAAAREIASSINRAREKPRRASDDSHGALAEALFAAGCLRFGDFELKSGVRSPVYVDLRRLTSHPETLRLVASALIRKLQGLEFDHVAAIPYSALPIGTSIALQTGWSLIYPRREAKDYGTRARVEGDFIAGQRAVVLDDLATKGDSKLEAITALDDAGLKVEDIVVLIDRQAGATETLASAGYRLHAVTTLDRLVGHLLRRGLISDTQAQAASTFLDG